MHTYIEIIGMKIPSYGLCMTFAVLLCSFLIIKKAKKSGISFDDIIIIIAVTLGTALFGGGLLYIIVSYTPNEIFRYIKNFDFSFLLNGGIVFYGGLLGGMLGTLACCKILNVSTQLIEVCVIPYIPLGHAIGRIGCMLSGCCYGFEYYGLFAVRNRILSAEKTYFPVQGMEALFDLLIMLILLLYAKKARSKNGNLICYLLLYSVVRFITEFFRGDEIRGGFLFFSTSQWISICIALSCVAIKSLYHIKKANGEKALVYNKKRDRW